MAFSTFDLRLKLVVVALWSASVFVDATIWSIVRNLRRRLQPQVKLRWFDRCEMMLVILAVVLSLIMVLLDVPTRVRFKLSKDSLSPWVSDRALRQGTRQVRLNDWLGLYSVDVVEYANGSAYFIVGRDGWGYGRGLAYCPNDEFEENASYDYICDDWYKWISYH